MNLQIRALAAGPVHRNMYGMLLSEKGKRNLNRYNQNNIILVGVLFSNFPPGVFLAFSEG